MSDQSEKDCKEYYEQIEKLQGGGPMICATMRDYFAAKAMAAMIHQVKIEWPDDKLIIMAAYRMADGMLAERTGKSANNDEPKSGEYIQYFSVAEGRWCGGKFIGMFLGRHVVGSAEGNVGIVEADQIRFAERAK